MWGIERGILQDLIDVLNYRYLHYFSMHVDVIRTVIYIVHRIKDPLMLITILCQMDHGSAGSYHRYVSCA